MTQIDNSKKAFLYRTTNNVNNKIYIGVRTYRYNKEDSEYLGSGIAIKAAIDSYGKENFTRETLLISSASYCYNIESMIVDESWVSSPNNYNIAAGGFGGYRGEEAKRKMLISKKKQFNRLPKEEQDRRLNQIKDLQPTIDQFPTGKDAAGWKGYWITPKGKFETCRSAATANKIDHRTLRNRCRDNNSSTIKKPNRIHNVPREWVGKTWNELGWGFSRKEVLGV